jgi:hypothetical protein
VAACGDAPSPTGASDAPRQGRMLRPDQASKVKPGDFIVIRPEEYAKYGISTEAGPLGTPTVLMLPPYQDCQLTPYGYDSCDPCYDQWGNYTCGGDPCYDQWGNYICGGGPTGGGVVAQFNQGSSAPYDGTVTNGGIVLKQLRLISFSQAIANVASSTVDAAFKNVGAAGGAGCNNTPYAFDTAHGSVSGSPAYVEVSRVAQWQGTIKWQVDGTHTFTPVSGATGGGTLYTTASFCG